MLRTRCTAAERLHAAAPPWAQRPPLLPAPPRALAPSELCEGFIKKYVQCYSCGNPETTIRVKKDFITLKCKACGAVRHGRWRRMPASPTRRRAHSRAGCSAEAHQRCCMDAHPVCPPILPPPTLRQVSDVDMRHKLNTFILKNPPENKLSKEEKRCGGAPRARPLPAPHLAAPVPRLRA